MPDDLQQARSLYRLMTWLSPAFPTGGYSYSHGIEYAVDAGVILDRQTLSAWIASAVLRGAGRTDGLLLAAAYRGSQAADLDALLRIAEFASASRSTSELGLESSAQGRAFAVAVEVAWPTDMLATLDRRLAAIGCSLTHPVAVGVAAASQRVPIEAVLQAYLHSFAGNLVSAGIRLIPLGQSDGVRAMGDLEAAVLRSASESLQGTLEEFGTATPMIDWASACHETQYTRLFRS